MESVSSRDICSIVAAQLSLSPTTHCSECVSPLIVALRAISALAATMDDGAASLRAVLALAEAKEIDWLVGRPSKGIFRTYSDYR